MTAAQTKLTHPHYRADIDGLRAIAILSVIGFHAFPEIFRGGFVGVDVFFVISGFLISTIIFGSLARNSFSFITFYARRIRRIFPALIVVLLSSLIAGWFILTADEYKQLGEHVAGGAGFVSNFVLWGESGYFDNAAETKPLLHLWSLGIEEQYYIVWPLLLWGAWKRKWNLITVTTALFAVSFLLNIFESYRSATGDFYSPQTRFWELMIGSALAYRAHRKGEAEETKRTIMPLLSVAGAALIILPVFVLNKTMTFPGWWALLPTLGAALIISAGAQAWFNAKVLSNRMLVGVGLISFPLYLWHWPLLSFAHIVEGDLAIETRIGAVVLSVLLAWLTYRFIEKPIQQRGTGKMVVPMLVLMTIAGSAGYAIDWDNGLEGYGYRVREKSDFADYFENSLPRQHYFETLGLWDKWRTDCDFYDGKKYRSGQSTNVPVDHIDKSCYTRDPAKKHTVFLWGDSHVQQLYYGLSRNLSPDWQVLIVASSGCAAAIVPQEKTGEDYCLKSNFFALQTIKQSRPDVVIIAQRDGEDFDGLRQIGNMLLKNGVGKVIFMGPTPHWEMDLSEIILRDLWVNTPERTFYGLDQSFVDNNKQLAEEFLSSDNGSFIYVNMIDFFCNKDGCLTRVGKDKKTDITSWDYGHLTPLASDFLAKNLLAGIVMEAGEKNAHQGPQ